MMEAFSFKSCRICGSDIHIDAQVCPLCSSRQQPKKIYSMGVILTLAVLGFLGILILGVISAHAIQQFISIRTNTSNGLALHDIKTAKMCVNSYIAREGRLPENLAVTSFTPGNEVTVILQKVRDRNFRLRCFHADGDKEYLSDSWDMAIYYKQRKQSGFRNDLTH
jgi:hypothetical protein